MPFNTVSGDLDWIFSLSPNRGRRHLRSVLQILSLGKLTNQHTTHRETERDTQRDTGGEREREREREREPLSLNTFSLSPYFTRAILWALKIPTSLKFALVGLINDEADDYTRLVQCIYSINIKLLYLRLNFFLFVHMATKVRKGLYIKLVGYCNQWTKMG